MMTRTKTIFASVLSAALLAVGTAGAGEITRETAEADFKWKSTQCVRPSRPFIAQGSPLKQALMKGYAEKVAYYLDCLKMEAQRDFDRAQVEMQEAVQRTLQTETDEMNDQVELMVRQTR